MGIVRYHSRSYECDTISVHINSLGMWIGHTKVLTHEGSKFKVTGEVNCDDLLIVTPTYCIVNGNINLCKVGNTLGCAGTVTKLQQGTPCYDSKLKEKINNIVNSFNSVGKRSNCIRLSGSFKSILIEVYEGVLPLGVELSGQFEKVRVLDSMFMETGVIRQAWIGNKLIST